MMKILRTASQGPILLALIKKIVYQAYNIHYGKVLPYILVYAVMVFAYHLKCLWLLLCPLFVIGKR